MVKKKVLIVDDDLGARKSLCIIFRDVYEVLEAESGEEALKILEEKKPDLVLLDLIMPQMSGVEVLKNIKNAGIQVPVIVISATRDTDMGREAMQLKAFGYLTKPFDVKELEGLIQKAINPHAVILVVDGELGVRESFRMILKDDYTVLTAASGQECLKIMVSYNPSLVVLDVRMSDIDGIGVLRRIKDINPYLPVIILTGSGTHRIAIEAIKLGAADFIIKPVKAVHLKETIKNTFKETEGKARAEKSSIPGEEGLKKNCFAVLRSLSKVIESKDPYTKRHSEQVAKYVVEIAKELGLADQEVEIVEQAALLHDIGKIGIRDVILHKQGKLNTEEWEEVRSHPERGEKLLRPFKLLHIEQTMIRHHHERFDGTGYPDRLKGEEIPIYARILAVADSYEAMISRRPYRRALSPQQAKEELEKCKSSQFDPKAVDTFLKVLERNGKDKEEEYG